MTLLFSPFPLLIDPPKWLHRLRGHLIVKKSGRGSALRTFLPPGAQRGRPIRLPDKEEKCGGYEKEADLSVNPEQVVERVVDQQDLEQAAGHAAKTSQESAEDFFAQSKIRQGS